MPNLTILLNFSNVSGGDVTAYSRYVSSAKEVSDILPEGYKPPNHEQEAIDYIREVHEKLITKHEKKAGIAEDAYARSLKNEGTLRTVTARHARQRIIFVWNAKRKKYIIMQGKEVYNKHYKRDDGFQTVLTQLSVLMQILDSWY